MSSSTSKMNRRGWLKSGALLTAGAALVPTLPSSLIAKNAHTFKPAVASLIKPSGFTASEQIDIPPMKARLLANENPFGPSKKAKAALKEAIDGSFRYGFRDRGTFINLIAEKEGVTPDHILLGAGSSELLDAAAMYFTYKTNGQILAGDLTYESLVRSAEVHGGKCDRVSITSDFKLDLAAMGAKMDDSHTMVYLCNPNNPTGTIVDPEELQKFCQKASLKMPVFIDEAYIDYTEDPEKNSMIKCVRKGYDVIVARTFSKLHAFAGLRIGYLVALPSTIEKISTFSPGGGGISNPSMAAAIASYQDTEFHKYSYDKNLESKEYLYKNLKEMGYEYIPSSTNFVLFPLRMRGDEFQKQMMAKGVGIRFWEYKRQHFCRVSLGTMEEMEMFVSSFKQVVG
jgi:histidinol-phosphate aminotransferase